MPSRSTPTTSMSRSSRPASAPRSPAPASLAGAVAQLRAARRRRRRGRGSRASTAGCRGSSTRCTPVLPNSARGSSSACRCRDRVAHGRTMVGRNGCRQSGCLWRTDGGERGDPVEAGDPGDPGDPGIEPADAVIVATGAAETYRLLIGAVPSLEPFPVTELEVLTLVVSSPELTAAPSGPRCTRCRAGDRSLRHRRDRAVAVGPSCGGRRHARPQGDVRRPGDARPRPRASTTPRLPSSPLAEASALLGRASRSRARPRIAPRALRAAAAGLRDRPPRGRRRSPLRDPRGAGARRRRRVRGRHRNRAGGARCAGRGRAGATQRRCGGASEPSA